jgi:hypothetical protein
MRLTFLLLLLLPLVATAQINRSASELARERIEEYLSAKLFRKQPYQSTTFGELKPASMADSEIVWMMEHRFSILEKGKESATVWQPYYFVFYFDKKIKILLTKHSW